MKKESVGIVLMQELHREGNMDTVKQKLKNRRLFLKRDAKLDKPIIKDSDEKLDEDEEVKTVNE